MFQMTINTSQLLSIRSPFTLMRIDSRSKSSKLIKKNEQML